MPPTSLQRDLHDACKRGDVDAVNAALDAGADPDKPPTASSKPPLQEAANHGHLPVCEVLIARGANVNQPADSGYTAIVRAIERKHAQVAALLIRHGADSNTGHMHDHPLALALGRGNSETVAAILDALPNKSEVLSQPIGRIVSISDLENPRNVRILLDHGFNPARRTDTQGTLLHYMPVPDGPLSAAEVKSIVLLISSGLDPEVRDLKGKLARIRTSQRHWEPVQRALEAAAKKSPSSRKKADTAAADLQQLETAARGGDIGGLRTAIAAGIDPSTRLRKGATTPLHLACQFDHSGAAEFLIQSGVDPNSTDRRGRSGVHEAAVRGSLACLRSLLAAGGDPNLYSSDGFTPLLELARGTKDRVEIARCLVEAGADIHATIGNHQPPRNSASVLHLAVFQRQVETVDYLLSLGADPNRVDANGETPGHLAVDPWFQNQPAKTRRVLAALLAHGLDPHSRTALRNGQTVIEMADWLEEHSRARLTDLF